LTTHKEFDNADTESTTQLASRAGSIESSSSDLRRARHGNVTVVGVGSIGDRFNEEKTRAREMNEGRSDTGKIAGGGGWNGMGIMVTNETSIRSERM
jgi:hypothetical protein